MYSISNKESSRIDFPAQAKIQPAPRDSESWNYKPYLGYDLYLGGTVHGRYTSWNLLTSKQVSDTSQRSYVSFKCENSTVVIRANAGNPSLHAFKYAVKVIRPSLALEEVIS
jgi:hypothetical protein